MAKNKNDKIQILFNPRAEKLINLDEWRTRYEQKIDQSLSTAEKLKRALFYDPMHLFSGIKQAFKDAASRNHDTKYYISKRAATLYREQRLFPEDKDIYVMQDTLLRAPKNNSFLSKRLKKFDGTQGKMNRARLEASNDCRDFSQKLKNGEIVPLPRPGQRF